jgi:hypothetical protein
MNITDTDHSRTIQPPTQTTTTPSTIRSFSAITQRMAAGDTGSTRSGGAASSDAFNKKESAEEGLYVKKQEAEKLAALRKKIADGEAALAKDKQTAEAMNKKQDS